jgi:hypothetical protein
VRVSDELTFDELLELLPVGGMLGTGRGAEFTVAQASPTFIEPTLKVVPGEVAAEATVTFISARGATGKTTLAKQLSATKQVPLWSLQQGPGVSADALRGRLMDYNGPVDALDAFLENEEAFIIVDSLDEAKMRVSGSSWNEFIRSLIEVSRSSHKLVLLGRERVLEDIWVSFADQDVAINWFEVSYFDQDQRNSYVDTHVQERIGTESYVRARDAVLLALTRTVDKSNANTFVGYAPVLDAVVALLKRGNLQRVYNDFSENAERRRLKVLEDILVHLLEREQDKVKPLADQLGLDSRNVYSPSEQFDWLIHAIPGGSAPDLDWCPIDKRHEYVEMIREFVDVHCFRSETGWASPVFSAYVAAQRFDHQDLRRSLRGIADSTGLLFEFVAAKSTEQFLDEWQFASLHASLMSGEWHGTETSVRVDTAGTGVDGVEVVQGELALLEGKEVLSRVAFDLVLEKPDRLSLFGPLAALSVTFPGAISVNRDGRALVLGPDLFLACRELEIICDSVQVSRTADFEGNEAPVVLEVAGDFRCDGMLSGRVAGDSFELWVPKHMVLAFPWVNYRQDLPPYSDTPNDRVVRFLNMFMILARKHGHDGDAAVYIKKVEGRQSIKGAELEAVLGAMNRHGVVYFSGDLIHLTSDWAKHRFSGKVGAGVIHLEDKLDVWRPVLDDMEATLAR